MTLGIDWFTGVVDRALTAYQINPVVHSLVIDGIFAGVGSVLSFLPTIVILFFFLSILEDTGYMARVAFVMDKLLRRIGLSGRSFVPMLVGFGCSVPAIMSTRTLASERDRRMTILLVPFMSCSARLPVYGLLTAAFFPGSAFFFGSLRFLFPLFFGAGSGIPDKLPTSVLIAASAVYPPTPASRKAVQQRTVIFLYSNISTPLFMKYPVILIY